MKQAYMAGRYGGTLDSFDTRELWAYWLGKTAWERL